MEPGKRLKPLKLLHKHVHHVNTTVQVIVLVGVMVFAAVQAVKVNALEVVIQNVHQHARDVQVVVQERVLVVELAA